MSSLKKIGLISDTHGLLRPQAVQRFIGSDLIIHAGDIGPRSILDELRTIAPVIVVRGNNDREPWTLKIPATQTIRANNHHIFVIHNFRELNFDPKERGFDVVISGHSHQPRVIKIRGVLYVNPGSAGPRRFRLPVAIGVLHLNQRGIQARIHELDLRS